MAEADTYSKAQRVTVSSPVRQEPVIVSRIAMAIRTARGAGRHMELDR